MTDSHSARFTFSYNPRSFVTALQNAIAGGLVAPLAPSLPPIQTVDTPTSEDEETERLESDRPTKRVRSSSTAGLLTPDASPSPSPSRTQFIENWNEDLILGKDVVKWTEHRGRRLSVALSEYNASEAGSGLATPPPSPGALSEFDGDMFIEGPAGGWNAIPVLPPGSEFLLSTDYELVVDEENPTVMPLVLSFGDTIGPRRLPVNGSSGGDKGFFFYDPSQTHIAFAISDAFEAVDIYQELEAATEDSGTRLLRYIGRFIANSNGCYLTADDFFLLSEEEQYMALEHTYLRQSKASFRLSREVIVNRLISGGRWFPKVSLTPVVHEVKLDDVMRARERILNLTIPGSELANDEQEVEASLSIPLCEARLNMTSPLSTLYFESEVQRSGGFITSFPVATEIPRPETPSRPPRNSKLFEEAKGVHVPLPSFVRHHPFEIMEFSDGDTKAGDSGEVGFPDSPEVTYEHRLLMDKVAKEERRLCEEEGVVHYRVHQDEEMEGDIDDTSPTTNHVERPSAPLKDYDDVEDEEEFWTRLPRGNQNSLASELGLLDESSGFIGSSSYISDITDDPEFEFDGSDEEREHGFFQREGSNPPEEWV